MSNKSIASTVVGALLLLAGCGDDTTTSAGGDLAAVSDLAVSSDLRRLACAGILACRSGCGQNLVCQQGCLDTGTTQAKSTFASYAGCIAAACASSIDGGSGKCAGATDASSACVTCLDDTATQAASTSGACHAQYLTCQTQ